MAKEYVTKNFNQEEESSFKFSDIWGLIWGHKWWFVLCMVIAILVAQFYLYRTPKTYQSIAKVLVDESTQDAAMRNLGQASAGMMKVRSFNSVENEVESFSSPDIMTIVVDRLGLQTQYFEPQRFRTVELATNSPIQMIPVGDNPHSAYSFMVSDKGNGKLSLYDFKIDGASAGKGIEGQFGDTLQTPVGSLAIFPVMDKKMSRDLKVTWTPAGTVAWSYCSKLSVELSGKESSVVVLTLTDVDVKRAQSVLQTLIDVYNEEWIRDKNRAAINTAEFINERLAVIEGELAVVEETLRKYKEEHNLTDVKAVAQTYLDESSLYASKAFEVNNQLSIAQYIKNYLADPTNSTEMIPSNLGLNNTSVETQIAEYNEIVLQRDRLLTGSGSNNPMIADLNSSLESIRSAILRSIDNLIATLDLQQAKIESQEKQILSRISSSSGQELQLLSIERQQQITQDLYMFLLQKREENELAALVNVGNTRVLMSPTASEAPVGPRKMLIMLVAFVLGFGIPFAFFFIRKMMDHKVKNRADLSSMKVPFLAEIPNSELKKNIFQKIAAGKSRKNDNKTNKIIVESGSRNMMNEAYRVLRTNMDMMLGKKDRSHVIMVTSFNPNSGKTFTSMNIAASMALKDAKVMLIDLDLRKASLSKALGMEHSGVAAYLNGKSTSYQENAEEIQPNLFVLPVGTLPPNPTELLLTDRFTQMIEDMRREYDYIFIDCPPIDLVADASIITEVVDMSVFIMRARMMDKRALPVVDELYKSGKYNHMAIILNYVDIRYKKYGYGKSSYGYGYGNDK